MSTLPRIHLGHLAQNVKFPLLSGSSVMDNEQRGATDKIFVKNSAVFFYEIKSAAMDIDITFTQLFTVSN